MTEKKPDSDQGKDSDPSVPEGLTGRHHGDRKRGYRGTPRKLPLRRVGEARDHGRGGNVGERGAHRIEPVPVPGLPLRPGDRAVLSREQVL